MSVNDGTYSKKQAGLSKNQTQSQNAQGRWVVTTKTSAPKSSNTPVSNSYTDLRNQLLGVINNQVNNTAPGKTINPTTSADVAMWGIPAKYASDFSAQFNLQLKAGVYDSYGNVSSKAITMAIRTAAGLTSQKFNIKENVLFDPIQKFYGISDMNSESTKTGLGKVAISIENAAGNWAFVTNPGGSGVAKLASTIPNIPTGTSGGTGGVSAEAAAAINAKASAQYSAYDGVLNTLDSWGMVATKPTKPTNTSDPVLMADYQSQLTTWQADQNIINNVKNMVYGSATQQVSQAMLLDYVRGTKAYQAAFPGLVERNAQGNASEHLTESAYQNLISTYRGTATQYGLPTLSNAQIASLVQNNISASEFNDRVTKGYTAALNADPATRAQLAKFGVNTSDLAHYYLDPKNSINKIEQTTAAATLAGYAQNVGLKGFDEQGARELADKVNLGVGSAYGTMSMSNVENALLGASRDIQLTTAAPGSNLPTVTTNQLIGSQVAGYGGTNQIAEQVQVARAEQAAAAPFVKGGGYAENAKGIVGLGSART
jgi:hypothetical protein